MAEPEIKETVSSDRSSDTQWDETPRSAVSRILGGSGLVLFAVWVLAVGAYVVWQMVNDDESVRFGALVGVALVAAVVLVLSSVLIDRLKVRKSDPYRKVMK